MTTELFIALALAVAVGLATAVSPFASSRPDGLEQGREGQGLPRRGSRCTASRRARRSRTTPSPASTTRASPPASPASSGTLGVFAAGYGLAARWPSAARRRRPSARSATTPRADRAGRRSRRAASTALDPRAKVVGLARRHASSPSPRRWRAWPVSAPARSRSPRSRRPRASPRATCGGARGSCSRSSLFVAAFAAASCAPAAPRYGSGRCTRPEDGLAMLARRRGEGDDRHGQRRAARRHDDVPGGPARARGAARAAPARADRGLHVPLPVRRRRGGRAHAGGARLARLPAAPRAAGGAARARGRRRCSCARTRAASACTWRCLRAASPGRCRALEPLRVPAGADAGLRWRSSLALVPLRVRVAVADELRASTPRGLSLRYPTGGRRSTASTSTSPTASASRSSAPTAPARRR